MQPNLSETRSEEQREGNRLVRQLECVVERNREIYQEAMTQFRASQSSYLVRGGSSGPDDS